ncbi:sorting nexin-like protein [Euroglyphus maynei]|uniref:Sorting nexin-like protein n=1 Tax=Euroglyphus maynei TaxID=6958 RepID=A0A1Y3BEG0_EURMA|nr:sorting nexin-like protein [Euroglyphus maynei]
MHVQKLHSPNDVDESSTLMINERQFNEFYTLESKLKEFHGEEIDAISLPPRRTFVRITKQLLETHREKFEQFLQQLLSNSSMKRSRLFYNFLNSPKDTFAENFNLTKMIRNVPSKFSKEKGQHLYSFLKNFINSCEKDSITTNGQQQQQSPKKQLAKNLNNPNNNNNKRRKSFNVQWPGTLLADNEHDMNMNAKKIKTNIHGGKHIDND